ncbi:MAG TPA: M56 family metallopeptidase [Terriglobales bacterium]|nr:M56 family metallopeptidase [Terriglobales bacterium]
MVRVLQRPNHRFLVWLTFSLSSAIYWFGLLIAPILRPASGPQSNLGGLVRIVFPAEWSRGIAAIELAAAILYVGAVLVLLARSLCNQMRLRALLSFGAPASAPFNEVLRSLCQELGVKKCELIVLPEITSPATVGWRNPRILVPENLHGAEELDDFVHIIRHEVVHVARRDYLLSCLEDLIACILFFHPAVWAARKQMRVERELASDLAVVEACPEYRAEYAASLARLVRLGLGRAGQALTVNFAAPASFLGKRIRTILFAEREITPSRQVGLAAIAFSCIALFALSLPWISMGIEFAPEERPALSVQQASYAGDLTMADQLLLVNKTGAAIASSPVIKSSGLAVSICRISQCSQMWPKKLR